MEDTIPMVDFKQLMTSDESASKKDVTEMGKQLTKALSEFGFAYLKNTGFSMSLVENAKEASKTFFEGDETEKKVFARDPLLNFGYCETGLESVNPERPGDFKQSFNISGFAHSDSDIKWPDNISPKFSTVMKLFMTEAKKMTSIILHGLSIGLGLKDEHFFDKHHSLIHHKDNSTTLRTLYYPPLTVPLKPGQIRLGEHSDYGSLTLLFQDEIGGLQVENLSGEYIDATPIKDTVLVNIGDLLQFWTRGKMKSTKHRVLVPEEETKRKTIRQSIAYFVHPNDDVLINMPLEYKEPKNGENLDKEREPITAYEYLLQKFSKSY